mmetsp:Transcript_18181/g.18231  ORF Transcript_18181/g.18231 Transcript_18181/m.18231 type:complete len:232 (-) Transcript_18181:238-933(-)
MLIKVQFTNNMLSCFIVLSILSMSSSLLTTSIVDRSINRKVCIRYFSAENDDIFGAEFRPALSEKSIDEPTEAREYQQQLYWKGRSYVKKAVAPERAYQSKEEFEKLRLTFVFDSIYISLLGLCVAWTVGSYKDAISYGIGSILGAAYAVLLGRYVQTIGTGAGGASGGARFAPVILLVLLYSKNKDIISIIPEIIGFFSFQLGSFLQIFNTDAYGESETENSSDSINSNQ